MYLFFLLVFLHFFIGGFGETEYHFGQTCTMVDYSSTTDYNYVLKAYAADVANVICRVEQPDFLSFLELYMEHTGLDGEETNYIVNGSPRMERGFSVNLTELDSNKMVNCCYKKWMIIKNTRLCRRVTFEVKGNSTASPRTKCVIVDLPTFAEVVVLNPFPTKNTSCHVTVNPTKVMINGFWNELIATCVTENENSSLTWYQKKPKLEGGYDTISLSQSGELEMILEQHFLGSNIECVHQNNNENQSCGSLKMREENHRTMKFGLGGTEDHNELRCDIVGDDQFKNDVHHLHAHPGDTVEIICRVENANPNYMSSLDYSDFFEDEYINTFSDISINNARIGHGLSVTLTASDDNKNISCCYDYKSSERKLISYCRYVQFMVEENIDSTLATKCVHVQIPTAVYVTKTQSSEAQHKNCDISFDDEKVSLGDTVRAVCVSKLSDSPLKWIIKDPREQGKKYLNEDFSEVLDVLQKPVNSLSFESAIKANFHVTHYSTTVQCLTNHNELCGELTATMKEVVKVSGKKYMNEDFSEVLDDLQKPVNSSSVESAIKANFHVTHNSTTVQCLTNHNELCGKFTTSMKEVVKVTGYKWKTEVIVTSSAVAVALFTCFAIYCMCSSRKKEQLKKTTINDDMDNIDTPNNKNHHYENVDGDDKPLHEEPVYEEIDTEQNKFMQIINETLDEYIIVEPKTGSKRATIDEYVQVLPKKRGQIERHCVIHCPVHMKSEAEFKWNMRKTSTDTEYVDMAKK